MFLKSIGATQSINDKIGSDGTDGSEFFEGVRFALNLVMIDAKAFFAEEYSQNGNTIPNIVDRDIASDGVCDIQSNNAEVKGEVSHA